MSSKGNSNDRFVTDYSNDDPLSFRVAFKKYITGYEK
jgi:hypothetical protein